MKRAKSIYLQTVGKTKAEYRVQEEELKKVSGRIERTYQIVEKGVVQKSWKAV